MPKKSMTIFQTVHLISGLIVIDQLSKLLALLLLNPLPSHPESFSLNWHIQAPNSTVWFSAIVAFLFIVFMWVCFILCDNLKEILPKIAFILFSATGLSNHTEMLARHGVVDFLSWSSGDSIWIFNLADIYMFVGQLLLVVWLSSKIKRKLFPI